MHKSYIFLFLILSISVNAQIISTGGNWTEIGDVNLSIVTSDEDNGDSAGDGAIFVDGQSTVVGQGITYTFGGTMTLGESIMIGTYTFNVNSSFVAYDVELYNLTDGSVLNSVAVFIGGNDTTPVQTTFNYTTISSDVSDVLQVRYIRTDNGNTARNFAIDNLSLNGTFVSTSLAQTCPFTVTPDLSIISSNAVIEAEITLAVNRFSEDYLGTSAPTSGQLSSAEAAYAAMNITVTSGAITGNATTAFNTASFLKTFAQQLKFNPGDTNIKNKANNTVWWVSKQFCSGTLVLDSQMYSYEDFARPASLLKDFLEPDVKDLFGYTLYKHSVDFEHYWEPSYDAVYQTANGTINTDLIYNISDAMMAYSLWFDNADERYRYMRGFKRYIDRFFSRTVGTTDGIKADGTGFHHWTAYNNYMYSFITASNLIYYLRGTSFQVDETSYHVFRDAVYSQYMQANGDDNGVQALSTNGRNPQIRNRQFNQTALKRMAITGGTILGLATADPIFAGLYNRIYEVDAAFNYSTVTPYTEGFFQFNHASAGVFRKNNWLAFNKGFSNNMWGSEIYVNQNRYGRYQSYGALEIIYPGDKESGNGYDVNTWDWNYNPGTTAIRLPWDKLHAERGRIDELQQKRFVGAVNLNKKNGELLQNNHGDYGMFAMDFQELEGQGFGTTHSSENHNSTFTFKKSNFFFDDIIICLGSGISNDDTSNNTITTLYQRIDNSGNSVNVNGTNQSALGEVTFSGASNNWLLSNYNTGFYLFSGGNSLKVNKENQQTPNQNQVWPVDYSSNPTDIYYTGYIDHGTNPTNNSYEYILKPDTSVSEMQILDIAVQAGNKGYTVHQQDANAHIVEHISKGVWGYAFFNAATGLNYDYLTDINSSALVMTQYASEDSTLKVSLTNPDIGFETRDYNPSISVVKEITLAGEWHFVSTDPAVQITSSNTFETLIEFTTVDGLSYEVMLQEGPEPCASSTTLSSSGWSNGIPSTTKKAVITSNYSTASGSIDACACEIKAGTTLIVEPGDYLKVEGNIFTNGNLIVAHQGSVVQSNFDALVVNNGSIKVNLTTPVLQNRDFMVLGSPMTNEVRTGVFNSAFLLLEHTPTTFIPHSGVPAGGTNFADDNGDFWNIMANGPINVGEGYIVRPQTSYTDPANISYNYTYEKGTLNNGNISRAVVYNGVSNPDGTPNVYANPYASAISANDLINDNSLINEVYFWEHLTPPSTAIPGSNSINFSMDDISMYNLSGGVAAANDPGMDTEPNGIISTGQGFGIKAFGNGTVMFNNSMRRISGNTTLRTPDENVNRIWLTVQNLDYEINSKTMLAFNPSTTSGIDPGYDSNRIATVISLYSHLEDGSEQLGIQTREAFRDGIKVPLGFSSQVNTNLEFTISISNLGGVIINGANAYLIDNELNVITDLTIEDYTFRSGKGMFNNRFTLLFEYEGLGVEDNALGKIIMYPNPVKDILNIVSPSEGINKIQIIDILGRTIEVIDLNGETEISIDIANQLPAVYFITITTESGIVTKRVIKV